MAFTDNEAVRGSFLKTWPTLDRTTDFLVESLKLKRGVAAKCGWNACLVNQILQIIFQDIRSKSDIELVGRKVDCNKAWQSWPLDWSEGATNSCDATPVVKKSVNAANVSEAS